MNALTVCRKCPLPHYDNCPRCAGFGVYDYDGVLVPVSASDACNPEELGRSRESRWMACPVCLSTAKGLPDTVEDPRE
jgi:hypothetical protein